MIAQLSLMESINPLSKINCVKFQKRTNKILLSPEEYSAPHPVPENAYGKDVKAIGFSGHHLGIAIDIGALTLGAKYFERHFTLDRTWKGTDHAASLEPDGLRKLARDLRTVDKALTFKQNDILDIEITQRQKLKRKVSL